MSLTGTYTKKELSKGIKAWQYFYKSCMKGKVQPLAEAARRAGINKVEMLNFLFDLQDMGYNVGQPDEGRHPAIDYLKELSRAKKNLSKH